jgi:hypothetical protein
MFLLYSHSDTQFGKIDVMHPVNGLYSDGSSDFSSLFSYILEGKDLQKNWQAPILKRLRPQKKLPDFLYVGSGPRVFSENAYHKLKEILVEGFFLPVDVEKTGEKVDLLQ